MSDTRAHIPVLREQVLAVLEPSEGDVYLDCTAGLGGHAVAVAERIGPTGCVVLNDVDPANLRSSEAHLRDRLSADRLPRIVGIHGNFADAPRRLAEHDLRADLVLADLGFSSNQVQDAERGLSFLRDGPLDMRMDRDLALTAADLVASISERDLASLLREFGEERDAARIARHIIQARSSSPINTTGQLAQIIRGPRTTRPGTIDPATRTFQALRIAVNDELGSLNSLLAAVRSGAENIATGSWLAPGARIAIITFHSLEDRPVKQAFRALAARALVTDLTRRPLEADDAEQSSNPRSRSAKLRAIRLADPVSGDVGPD